MIVKPMITTTITVIPAKNMSVKVAKIIAALVADFPKYANNIDTTESKIVITFHWHDTADLSLYTHDLDSLERRLLCYRDVIHVTSDHHSLGLHLSL